MNPRKSRLKGLTLCIATFSTTLVLVGCEGRSKAPQAAALPKVVVATVNRMTLPIVATSNGTTRAINEVAVRARVKGFLKEKLFAEGAYVKPGQLLLVIDEEPFKVKLAQASASLSEANAALKKAEQSKAIDVAKAQLALDQASANLAQVELARERALYARKATPLEEVDRKDAMQKRSAAQVDSSKASLDQAKADYDVNIASAKASVDQAKATVRDAEIELGYCKMTAPLEGRIGELMVKVGNLVGTDSSTELVTIRQLDPMGFDIRPSSRYLPRINRVVAAGIPVSFMIQGERAYEHSGKVVFIDNKVDVATSTVLLKAEVPNPDKSLLPGEYIKTRAVVGEYKDVLAIPEQALVEGQAGFTVFVVDEQGIVDRVKVVPADTVEGFSIIESGLTEGQKVIVEGVQLVRKGSKVDAKVSVFERKTGVDADSSTHVPKLETDLPPPEEAKAKKP